MATDVPDVTVTFPRLEDRGLLLGLSLPALVAAAVAVGVAVLTQYSAGTVGLLAAAPLWLTCAALAVVPIGGRPAISAIPVLAGWALRRTSGGVRHRQSPTRPVDGLGIPGLAGVAVVTSPASGCAYVVDRRGGTVTAVLAVGGRGFALADAGTQAHRLGGWGRVLAGLCQRPGVVRAQVLVRTRPAGAAAMRTWWSQHALSASPWAARIVDSLVETAQTDSRTTESLLAVTLRAPRSRGKGLEPRALDALDQQLEPLADAVRAADLDVTGWLDTGGVARMLRAAYDPYAPGGRAGVGSTEEPLPAVAVEERWDALRTDSAAHAVFWIREWPRSEVYASFLQPLLANGAHRTLSLTCEPLTAQRALRDIRRAKVEQASDAAQRARIGQVEDEAHRAEAADVARREAELVSGHGDLRFTGLLTVSAPDPDALDAACALTESAAAQAMCELRRLTGQQSAAFVAGALPLARSTT